ncbi:MAG: hypothetical protein H6734_14875 [Alphaproteobacteria bacterium]|nr:hypothetical protein [Alphaproteobacteria bacterium]
MVGQAANEAFGRTVSTDGTWVAARGTSVLRTFLLASDDMDGDGWGPVGDGGGDCDDSDPAVNPDAVEIVGNAVDENCDGNIAEVDASGLVAGDLTIVEILRSPVALPNGPFVEIVNTSSRTVSLEGLSLETRTGASPVDTATLSAIELGPGGRAAIGRDVLPVEAGFTADAYLDSTLTLPSSGTLELVGSTVVDAVTWTSLPVGASRSLHPASTDASLNDDADALPWCDSRSVATGGWATPGETNDTCNWTMPFDFDWILDDGTHIQGSTTVQFKLNGNIHTGNGGTGTGSWSTTAAGQTVTWTYANTGITYTGTRAFGTDCWSRSSVSGQPATVDGWWVGTGCELCPGDADSDADEVCDASDICAAGDDHLDTDGDDQPDACDPCPVDNPDDTDGDSVCDADDACPGDDDLLDTDTDGVPDCLDPCPLDRHDDDGSCDSADLCPGGDDDHDRDHDGVPNACDPCPDDDPDDSDGDGVCESDDVCDGGDDTVDTDDDGIPDACDACPNGEDDTDRDDICDPVDACPYDAANDADGDGVCGDVDVCPGSDDSVDSDGDGKPDGCDPCPADNPDDSDLDGNCDSGDVCAGFDDTIDTDGDGIPDGCDSCPADIEDRDQDGVCDSKDPCPDDPFDDSDGDGSCDWRDLCPGSDDLVDSDFDTVPDGCDPCPLDPDDDADGDGLCADVDPCPDDAAPDDDDGDGVCDSDDACAGFDDTIDTDSDGFPDLCEPAACIGSAGADLDDDGVCDGADACPGGDDTIDTDSDGVPDACDDDSWCNSTGGGGYLQNQGWADVFTDGDTLRLLPGSRPGACLDWQVAAPIVLQRDCDGSAGQDWVWHEATGTFEAGTSGTCLDLVSGGLVVVSDCASVAPTGIDPDARLALQDCSSCAEGSDASDGGLLLGSPCDGSSAQRFAAVPVLEEPTLVSAETGTLTANGRPNGLAVWGPQARPILTSPDRSDQILVAVGTTRGGGRVGASIDGISGVETTLAEVQAWVDAAPGVTLTVRMNTPWEDVQTYLDHLHAGGGIVIDDATNAIGSTFPKTIGSEHSVVHAVLEEAGMASSQYSPDGMQTGDSFASRALDPDYDNVTDALVMAARDALGIETADTSKALGILDRSATAFVRFPSFHPAVQAQAVIEEALGAPAITDAAAHTWGADDTEDIRLYGSFFVTQGLRPDQNGPIATASTYPGEPGAGEQRVSVKVTVPFDPNSAYSFTGYYAAPGETVRIDIDTPDTDGFLHAFIAGSNGMIMPHTRWNAPDVIQRHPSAGAFTTLNVGTRTLNAPLGGPILLNHASWWDGQEEVEVTLHNVLPLPTFELGVTDETAFQAEIAATAVPYVVLRSSQVLFLAHRDEVAAATDSITDILTMLHRYRIEETTVFADDTWDDQLPEKFFFDVQDGLGAHSGNPAYLAHGFETDGTAPMWSTNLTDHKKRLRGLWGYGHEMGHSRTLKTPYAFPGAPSSWTEAEPNLAHLAAQARVFGYSTLNGWRGYSRQNRIDARCEGPLNGCSGTCTASDYSILVAMDLWLNITDSLGVDGMQRAYEAWEPPASPDDDWEGYMSAWALELSHAYQRDFGPYLEQSGIPLSTEVTTTMDALYPDFPVLKISDCL